MFQLDANDQTLVARSLGPAARSVPVVSDLRGWAWTRPPLSPVFDAPLCVDEVVDDTCPTARPLYLTRVLGVTPRLRPAQREARLMQRTVEHAVVIAKRALYAHAAEAAAMLPHAPVPPISALLTEEAPVSGEQARRVTSLWEWQMARLSARIHEAVAQAPGAHADTLVALAVPYSVARRFDGRRLGLGTEVVVDALLDPGATVASLTLDEAEAVSRVRAAGLALAVEAAHDTPVEIGCTVTLGWHDGHPALRRDLHTVDDEARQRFIEQRDERSRLVQEEVDPGLPALCPDACPYFAVCHP